MKARRQKQRQEEFWTKKQQERDLANERELAEASVVAFMTSVPEPCPNAEIDCLTRDKKILRDRLKQTVRLANALAERVEKA